MIERYSNSTIESLDVIFIKTHSGYAGVSSEFAHSQPRFIWIIYSIIIVTLGLAQAIIVMPVALELHLQLY